MSKFTYYHESCHDTTTHPRIRAMRYTILIVLLFAGCGGSSPTAPTPQPPILQGQYSGGYLAQSCQETGAAIGSNFCLSLGSGGAMVYTPQQSGTTITGTMSIGGFTPFLVSGTVSSDQSAVLAGSGPIEGFNAAIALTQWRGIVSGPQITGTYQYTISTTLPTVGSATVSGSFSIQR
jgi:hypothetical protein